MRTKIKTTSVQTTALYFRYTHDGSDEILVGKCASKKNPCYGMYIPPGGHVEEGESHSEAAIREGKEEVGLIADPASVIFAGSLTIRFASGKVIYVSLFEATKWTGSLRMRANADFTNLCFCSIDTMPWHDMPIGDAALTMDIFQKFTVNYSIWCNTTRHEVLRINSAKYPRN